MLKVYSERQPHKITYPDGRVERFDPFFRWHLTNGWIELGIPNFNAIGFMWKCRIGDFSRIKKKWIEIGRFTFYINVGSCPAYNPRTGEVFE